MIVLADVLSRQEVLEVREGLAAAPFRDGRATAGPAAEQVKNNEQARGDDPGVIALGRRVRLAMEAHPVVRAQVRPARWSSLMFSRYGAGHEYGLHADNAAMYDEGGWPLRTDVSFTVFLSDLDAYEGGALLLRDLSGDREFRPQAGSAVLYATGQLHAVTPVTRGVRLACVGWVQSRIRRPDQRDRAVPVGLQPGGPVPQGAGVRRAQLFHVEQLEPQRRRPADLGLQPDGTTTAAAATATAPHHPRLSSVYVLARGEGCVLLVEGSRRCRFRERPAHHRLQPLVGDARAMSTLWFVGKPVFG